MSSLFFTPDRMRDSDRKVIYYKADRFNFTDGEEKEFSFGENSS
jgi:hypothetical protein